MKAANYCRKKALGGEVEKYRKEKLTMVQYWINKALPRQVRKSEMNNLSRVSIR